MKRLLIFVFSVLLGAAPEVFAFDNTMQLWYEQPSFCWEEYLAVGNGRLGAMVAGTVRQDTIQINEDTFWNCSPYNNTNPQAREHLQEMRDDLCNERWEDAQRKAFRYVIADKNGGKTSHGAQYQSAGDVILSFHHKGEAANYRRWLDISEAVTGTSYTVDGVTYTRQVFSSFADDVTVIRLTASKKGKLNVDVAFAGPLKDDLTKVTGYSYSDNNTLEVMLEPTGETFENVKNGLHLVNFIRVVTDDGKVTHGSTSIQRTKLVAAAENVPTINVAKATAITIVISSATNFVNYRDISGDARAKALGKLEKWSVQDRAKGLAAHYEDAKREHTDRYRALFGRVAIDLGNNKVQEAKDTKTRIREFGQTKDPSLAALYFQFGRYLLISSSWPGTQPANLQGIWNPNARAYPAWDSKYTANINVEMNYWPAEVCNLSECHEPFLKLIKEVSETGRQSAQEMYGARGWTLHHNTDIWRATGAVDYASCAVWPTCNAWFCSHLWEHYLYTGDRDFLRQAYPVMKSAAEFYQDFLYKEPKYGYMVAGPSVSPENNPGKGKYHDEWLNKDQSVGIFHGLTMDNQMIYDLLKNTSEAAGILGVDADFARDIDTLRSQLPPMSIGKYGQLQEWLEDWDRETSSHRHVSHLWGMFPGNMISPWTQPQLFQAVKKSLIGRGDGARGWSMGWKVCLWARLLDAEHALRLMKNQLRLMDPDVDMHDDPNGGTYANMFDAHPPFQIDGNFGCCAGIAEMMVQSYTDAIHLLPAVPKEWGTGEVSGLVTRGGFEIEKMTWKDGRLQSVTIKSRLGGNLRLRSAEALVCQSGHNMVVAEGENTNALTQNYPISSVKIVDETKIPALELPQTQVYDIATKAGDVIVLKGDGEQK